MEIGTIGTIGGFALPIALTGVAIALALAVGIFTCRQANRKRQAGK